MIRRPDRNAWEQFTRRLPAGRDLYQVLIPTDLTYHGVVRGNFDYVLPESTLRALRTWLAARGENEILYFLTETVGAEPADFVISLSSLSEDELLTLNTGRESAFAGLRGDWALFLDHEGGLHVAGPADLYETSRAVPG